MVLLNGRFGLRAALVAALLTMGTVPAAAQSSVGVTGGASIDPEQLYVGVYWQSPDIGGRFRLRPGLDGGFGQNMRLGTVNLDFAYLLPLGQSQWSMLSGGGPTVVITRFTGPLSALGTDVSAGASWLVGFAHDSGFHVDIRGSWGWGGRVPGLKLGVGWALTLN